MSWDKPYWDKTPLVKCFQKIKRLSLNLPPLFRSYYFSPNLAVFRTIQMLFSPSHRVTAYSKLENGPNGLFISPCRTTGLKFGSHLWAHWLTGAEAEYHSPVRWRRHLKPALQRRYISEDFTQCGRYSRQQSLALVCSYEQNEAISTEGCSGDGYITIPR